MKDLKLDGFTYTVVERNWKKGNSRFEVIKFKTGFRNLWERVTVSVYNEVKRKISEKSELTTQTTKNN